MNILKLKEITSVIPGILGHEEIVTHLVFVTIVAEKVTLQGNVPKNKKKEVVVIALELATGVESLDILRVTVLNLTLESKEVIVLAVRVVEVVIMIVDPKDATMIEEVIVMTDQEGL